MKTKALLLKIMLVLIFMSILLYSVSTPMAADVENCALCHQYSGLGRIDKDGKKRLFYINEDAYTHSVHGRLRCKDCHVKVEKFPHADIEKVNCATECHLDEPSVERKFSHNKMIKDFELSVHGKGPEDNPKEYPEDLPVCTYCHQNRTTEPLMCTPGEKKIACEVLNRCLGCHEDENWTRASYSHLTHRLKQRRSSMKMVELCASCHENEEKMKRHNLEATGTYRDSFHWQAIKYDDPNAPNCIDCHAPVGYFSHEIMPKTNLRSAIHKDNLVSTCSNPVGLQLCHPGATPAFAQGKIHPSGVKARLFDTQLVTADKKEMIKKGELKPFKSLMTEKAQEELTAFQYYQSLFLNIIKYFYLFLIGGLISFMIVHQILDFFATRRERKIGTHHGPGTDTHQEEKYYIRMNIHERVQHHLVYSTFITLAVTGFMLEFPDEIIAVFGKYKEAVFVWRGLLHRIAAVLMILNVIYQIWYGIFTKAGWQNIKDLAPGIKDGKDLIQNLAYYLRITQKKPQFDRYNYKEKMEYWSGWIGNSIIIFTGFILWIEYLFPKYLFDVSILMHTMEAILASSAIMVWHFYEVHWKPGKFPMSTIWLDGEIPEHELEEEHPLQYQRIKEAERMVSSSEV
jgi:cytochrome b subunit of formate dehydrogenase